MRTLLKPTNFATMFEDIVQAKLDEAKTELEKANEANPHVDQSKTVDENAIRESNMKKLHHLMDQQIQKRYHRLKHAQAMRKTEQQWDLIAAAVEQAVIEFYQLKDAEAKKMRGRFRITFQKKTSNILQRNENEEDEEDNTRLNVLQRMASQHTQLGKKLKIIGKRMITNAKQNVKQCNTAENRKLNESTKRTNMIRANEAAAKKILTDQQKEQTKSNWHKKRNVKSKNGKERKDKDEEYDKHIAEIQKEAQEFDHLKSEFDKCNLDNVIHAAKIVRLGEMHIKKAAEVSKKMNAERARNCRETNSSKAKGAKIISKAIGSKQGQPLIVVERDRDTKDGGKRGELTSNPQDIDAVVKRAWQSIHEGIGGNVKDAIGTFLNTYNRYIAKPKHFQVRELTGQRVLESFSRTKESAGAMDGWAPKEMSLLSLATCTEIAILLNQVEEGAPWPASALHARVVFLEKEGAQVGKLTSYRPLTITAPLYRCWGTMRLEDCADWVDSWALPEMYAGVPGKGAADAWHAALTDVEEHKLKGNAFCGAVADIMKFFDMIRRDLVYEMARAAGMPDKVLVAYRAYLENMQVYNCLAEGGGGRHPILEEMRHPARLPFLYVHGRTDHATMDSCRQSGGRHQGIHPRRRCHDDS